MQHRNNKKNNNRPRRDKIRRRGKRGGGSSVQRAMGLNQPRVEIQKQVGASDMLKSRYSVVDQARIIFNTAATTGTYSYAANDLILPNITAGTGMSAGYFYQDCLKYQRARVIKSVMTIDITNRELVNPIQFLVVPADSSTPSLTGGFAFSQAANIIGSKAVLLQAQNGGGAMRRLVIPYNLVKREGPTYTTQDEYAMTGSASSGNSGVTTSPVIVNRFVLAFFNPAGANTASTGGLIVSVRIKYTVVFDDPDKNVLGTNPFYYMRDEHGETIKVAADELEARLKKRDLSLTLDM